jgi:hypothetical protein
MANHEIEHYDPEDHDETVHHEESDVNVRGILTFAAVFVVLAVVMYVGLWVLLKAFRADARAKDKIAVSEVKGSEERQIPPAPHLQPFPENAAMGGGGYNRRSEGSGTELSTVPARDPWLATPAYDMAELRKEYDAKLTTYGWVDQRRGIVRIPIALAKENLLKRGLPVRQAPVAAPAVTAAPGAQPTTTPAANIPAASEGQGSNPAKTAPETRTP